MKRQKGKFPWDIHWENKTSGSEINLFLKYFETIFKELKRVGDNKTVLRLKRFAEVLLTGLSF